jgi:hypothetical protein
MATRLALQRLVPAAALGVTAAIGAAALWAPPASAATPGVAWAVHSVASPTRFQPTDPDDLYTVLVENVGTRNSSVGGSPLTEDVKVVDTLPAGVTTSGEPRFYGGEGSMQWECLGEGGGSVGPGEKVVTCYGLSVVPSLTQAAKAIGIPVSVEPAAAGPLMNSVTVSQGGASQGATTTEQTQLESPALPALQFEPLDFSASALDAGGELETHAAGHPGALATTFTFPTAFADTGISAGQLEVRSLEDVKHVVIDLPPGVVGDPLAAPTCSLTELEAAIGTPEGTTAGCKPATRIGALAEFVQRTEHEESGASPGVEVFNMIPEHGYPAEFGAYDPAFQKASLLYPRLVGSGADAHVQVVSGPLTQYIEFTGISTIFFGDPAEKDNSGQLRAFFSNPSDCSQKGFTTTLHLDSWQHPGRFKPDGTPDFTDPNWKKAQASSPPVTGCGALHFNPSLEATPSPGAEGGTTQADTPSGYLLSLRVPQGEEGPNSLATPPLKTATVTLPAGVAISPSAANGLLGCQENGSEGIEPASTAAGHCPAKSKVGEAELLTPLLKEPLKGSLYVAQPPCGGADQPECTEEGAETGNVFALYLEIGSEDSGVHIKLKGTVEVGGNGHHNDLQPGQVRTTFADAPQQPFSELKLKLNGGPRAVLANPQSCGSFDTTSELEPWSHQPAPGEPQGTSDAAVASPPFTIAGCESRFAPSFSAGTFNPQAGAFSPFTLTFSRHDREQDLSGVAVNMPQGLLGKIAGIPQCPEAQANAGTCPAASRVGTATSAAGSGSTPLWQSGPVYLTGPYKGAPFGLSVAVPAKAGPFNLGTIVVRAAIYVDPRTAQLTVVSDPLPQSVDGVPLRLQTVNVTVDREGFMFNPTSCDPTQIGATLTGTGGASVRVASRFQAAGCAGLPWKPSFTVSTQGRTSKANGASLDVKVAQKPGEADIHRVDVQLPLALPSRLTTLQKACPEAQFAANPAGCPEGSNVGMAIAHTPVLNAPLAGPAYLVSHGGAAFPDLDIVLQGEGVTIVLTGNTDIKKGITFSRFETVPDAPITSFELSLPEGPHSIFGTNIPASANHSLCGQKLVMPTMIVGQNGGQVTQSTNIAVTGCGKPSIKITKAKIKANTVLLTVTTTQQGTVTVSGNGLKTIKKTLAAGAHQLKVSLTNNGRTARKHHKKTKVKASVKNSNGSSSKTMTLKL